MAELLNARPNTRRNAPPTAKPNARLRTSLHWLFPLTVFAFSGTMVSYVQLVFNNTTRWLALAVLAAYLVQRGTILLVVRSALGPVLLLCIYWTLVTTGWSEQLQLSLFKSLAFAIVALTFTSAGIQWVHSVPSRQAFAYTLPLAALAIFAALWPGASANTSNYGETTIYRGLSGNPNALGILCAMGFIGTLAALSHHQQVRVSRIVLWVVAALLCLVMLWAKSRASMLVMLCTGIGFLVARRMTQQAVALVFAAWAVVIVGLAFPRLVDKIEATYVRKGVSVENGGVLHSRRDVWIESYEQALKGGWIGGGYGVTIGEGVDFGGGVTTFGYGREKANSQLAIIEEMGWFGFAIYCVLLMVLFRTLVSGLRAATDEANRSNLCIAIGGLAGMVLNSAFEAWWVAPGSAEAPFFWGLAGVALGLSAVETSRRRAAERKSYEAWWRLRADARRSREAGAVGRPGWPGG